MRILLYLLNFRIGYFLKESRKPVTLLVRLSILLSILLNTYLFAWIMNYLYTQKKYAAYASLSSYLAACLFVIPVLSLFIPYYKNKLRLFKPTDPVSVPVQTFIEIGYHITSPLYLTLYFSSLLLYFLSAPVTLLQSLTLTLLIATGGIGHLIIQTALEADRNKKLFILPALLFPFALIIGILNLPGAQPGLSVIAAIIATFLFMLLKYYEPGYQATSIHSNASGKIFISGKYTSLISVYFRTGSIRLSFIIALLFKCTFLFLTYRKHRKGGEPDIIFGYLQFALISSVILFTYVHNNIWGYLKKVYRNIAGTKSLYSLFKAYLSLLCIPVLIDLLLSGPFMILLFRDRIIEILLFYFVSLFYFVLIGFIASLDKPWEVKKAIDFTSLRSNTPMSYNFLALFICGALGFLALNNYFLPAAPVFLLIAVILYYRLIYKKRIEKTSKSVYYKL